jgi:hypothetical protein
MSGPLAEWELESEWELEGEEFLARPNGPRAAVAPVARAVAPVALSPNALRQLGPIAARAVLAAGSRGVAAPGMEGEFEEEYEGEYLLSPVRRVYADAMMEHFGHVAAQAESEAEAEAFIGALVPLAARMIPRIAPTIMRNAPGLIRGVAGLTRTLRRNPATRPLVRAVPTIVRRTVADVGRQRAGGRPITAEQAVRLLARQTNRVLSRPDRCAPALRRAAVADRHFHRGVRAKPRHVAV